MSPATLDATLRTLGSAPVVSADLDTLEARLLSAIGGDPAPIANKSARRRVGPLLIGAVAACLLALVVLAAGWFTAGDDQYVLAAAVDVEVVLPDGEVVAGAAGLALPVGAMLSVGGSMEVDGTTYGPGDYVITEDGPVAADRGGGGGSGGDVDPGDGSDMPTTGTPTTGTSTTVAPRDPVDEGGPPPEVAPPVVADPATTVRPADAGDTRPTTLPPRDQPPPAPTTEPPRSPTTTPPRDQPATTPPRDPPPTTTTPRGNQPTTTIVRGDSGPREPTTSSPPRRGP